MALNAKFGLRLRMVIDSIAGIHLHLVCYL